MTRHNQAHSFLTDLADFLTFLAVQKLGADEQASKDFGKDIATFLAQHWGGQTIYFPIDTASRTAARNASLYAEFSGKNQAELAQKYKLSTQHVYNIIRNEQARHPPKKKK